MNGLGVLETKTNETATTTRLASFAMNFDAMLVKAADASTYR